MATIDGKKTGGRQKGTPNKTHAALRLEVGDIVEANLETLMLDLLDMKPTDRVNALIQLMKFCMPTLKAVEIEDTTPKEPTGKFAFVFLDKDELTK